MGKNAHPVLYVVLTIIAEFMIIMDAGAFGYWIGREIAPFEQLLFWVFLMVAAVCRYIAEKIK